MGIFLFSELITLLSLIIILALNTKDTPLSFLNIPFIYLSPITLFL